MNRVTDRKQTCGHQKGEGWGWGEKPGVWNQQIQIPICEIVEQQSPIAENRKIY